eukprot:5345811-Amphidinium_carterae.1
MGPCSTGALNQGSASSSASRVRLLGKSLWHNALLIGHARVYGLLVGHMLTLLSSSCLTCTGIAPGCVGQLLPDSPFAAHRSWQKNSKSQKRFGSSVVIPLDKQVQHLEFGDGPLGFHLEAVAESSEGRKKEDGSKG